MNLMPPSHRPPSHRYNVVFRADASIDIGTGHIMRCLTLADMLAEAGFECRFVCRAHTGNLSGLIRQRGFAVSELQPDSEGDIGNERDLAHSHWLRVDWQRDARQTIAAIGDAPVDWLIVDHYALDIRWERFLRSSTKYLMVLDDLADREHSCDLLLDQSLGRASNDYRPLVPAHCQILVGARFALLRPQFAQKRSYSLARRRQGVPRRLLVTLGGVDRENVTERVLCALEQCALPNATEITVVMGQHAPWADVVREKAAQLQWKTTVMSNVDDMASLMSDADLAIGAAGSTSWERCALGVPTILMVLAENQREVAQKLAIEGAAKIVELGTDFDSRIGSVVESLIWNKMMLDGMSERAATICDGEGGLEVARQIAYRLGSRV
ncbi:UDP-N-acetylglucosamine-N-acetylmuramyl-(pentapeptide) pyrophosphoryl-undecaprenol N-acetylglucosamine transferase (plasmid) [Sinorhizobium fredii HH103]|uniref:RkpO n=1 Tax=Sinorhizobium fredii (strain HH103) TaxID=1117943 RepID=G9AI93_SINF1|nr:RkpO [Sinorhizobium fredii HH103]CCF00775.1 UDP-N-acetylglucosamine-N-acetylmuramyl-(pentapeptide) pyrophosphoryl-undecaprenol N-acetylglucosamine transferase [Sinorhizobium fredii HH103]